jgi:hypothetical protein
MSILVIVYNVFESSCHARGTSFYTMLTSFYNAHNFGTTKVENALLSLALYQAKTMFKTLFFGLAAAAAVAPAGASTAGALAAVPFPSGKNRCKLEPSHSFLCGIPVATRLWAGSFSEAASPHLAQSFYNRCAGPFYDY